jgi:hypothetical protein
MSSLLAPIKDIVEYSLDKNNYVKSRSKKGKLLKVILSLINEFIVASQITKQLLNGYQI